MTLTTDSGFPEGSVEHVASLLDAEDEALDDDATEDEGAEDLDDELTDEDLKDLDLDDDDEGEEGDEASDEDGEDDGDEDGEEGSAAAEGEEEGKEPEAAKAEEPKQQPAQMLPADVEAAKQGFTEMRGHAKQAADYFLNLAQQFLPQKPDQAMAQEDPLGYMQAKAQYDAAMEQVALAEKAREKIADEEKAEQDQQQKIWLAEQQLAMKTLVPEWFGENQNQVRAEVAEYAASQGFTQERLEGASALDLSVLRKAFLYDQSQAQKATDAKAAKAKLDKAKRKAAKAPSVQKPGVKRAGGASDARIAQLRKRAEKTGSLRDVAALLEAENS